MSVADPIEAISGVKKTTTVGSTSPTKTHLAESEFLYNTNYVIAVMKLTQVCMQHQQELVSIRSKLAEVTTKIQADLNVINQYMSTLENKAGPSNGDTASPDYLNGFGQANGADWNHWNGTWGVCADGTDRVDQSYASSTQSFVNAFMDLFYASSDGASKGLTVNDLMTMDNPADSSKPFDLSGFWTKIGGGFNGTDSSTSKPGLGLGFDDPKSQGNYFRVISTDRLNHPSLIQQYIYYQAKLNLFDGNLDDVKAAGTDFMKIPGMNFDPREDNFDANLSQILTVITAMNQTVQVDNGVGCGGGGDGKSPTVWATSKDTLLRLIAFSSVHKDAYLDDVRPNSTSPSSPNVFVGLYGAGSFLAYNYFWTKDPQAKDSSNNTSHIVNGDMLSDLYTKTSSAQAGLSSASSAQGTNFQQDTSGMTTENNEVQQIISSFMQGQGAVVGNFKGA